MKRIAIVTLLILLLPSVMLAEELRTPKLHIGVVSGIGGSYIGSLGENPFWEPRGSSYVAPALTYYAPSGLALRGEFCQLKRTSEYSEYDDDNIFYREARIDSKAMHTSVTVLYSFPMGNNPNKYYIGAGLYLDTILKADLYAEHSSSVVLRQSILDEYGPVSYGASLLLGMGMSKTFYAELVFLTDISSFDASALRMYDLQTQSLFLRLGMDLAKINLSD